MYLMFVILFLSVGMLHVYDYRTTTPPQQNIEQETHFQIILTTMKQVKNFFSFFFYFFLFSFSQLIFIYLLVFNMSS